MAIGNINQYPFLQASNPYGLYGSKPVEGTNGYHQAQGAPTTTPVITPKYSQDDMYAFMENYNSGNINPVNSNPFVGASRQVENPKGALWGDGFVVPPNNGTGELSPNYGLGREDEIIGLDFKC